MRNYDYIRAEKALDRLIADLQEPACTIKLRRKRRKKRNQKYLYIRDMY